MEAHISGKMKTTWPNSHHTTARARHMGVPHGHTTAAQAAKPMRVEIQDENHWAWLTGKIVPVRTKTRWPKKWREKPEPESTVKTQ